MAKERGVRGINRARAMGVAVPDVSWQAANNSGLLKELTAKYQTVIWLPGRAQNALLAAERIAKKKQAPVGLKHVLLGIASDRDSFGVRILTQMGVDIDRFSTVLTGLEEGAGEPTAIEVAGTSREEARVAGSHYVGTEYLLLGSIKAMEDKPFPPFEQFGITRERVKDTIREVYLGPQPRP